MLELKNTLLIALAACLLAVPASSQNAAGDAAHRLAPLQDGDLAAVQLVELTEKAARPDVPREPVSFTFPLTADPSIDLRPTPFEAASREYFVEVTASDLRAGTKVHVTVPGAVIRINPAPGPSGAKAMALDPASLVVRSARGAFDQATGLSLLADAASMKATGVPFAEGTTTFRLAPEVGVGAVTLQAPALKAAGRYQIHVFDAESPYVMGLRAQGMDYLHGQTLTAATKLAGPDGAVALDAVQAYVTSPAGRAWPVIFTATAKGAYRAEMPLDAVERGGQGLWELHVAARGQVDGLEVVRSARTAFGVHVPTAGFAGDVTLRPTDSAFQTSFAVNVATPGRYEVRGILFGTDTAGKLRPVAAGHSADWLSANGTLTLSFDKALLAEAGVGAPFELRDLRLLDQGRMGVLHRQAIGLVVK